MRARRTRVVKVVYVIGDKSERDCFNEHGYFTKCHERVQLPTPAMQTRA